MNFINYIKKEKVVTRERSNTLKFYERAQLIKFTRTGNFPMGNLYILRSNIYRLPHYKLTHPQNLTSCTQSKFQSLWVPRTPLGSKIKDLRQFHKKTKRERC